MGIGHHIFCKNITITFKIYGKVMKHILLELYFWRKLNVRML